MDNIAKAILLAGLSLLAARANAALVTNLCTADTSLIEVAPTNNNGAQAWVLSGGTQNGPRTRGLYKFDLSNLPARAVIQAATVVLEVTRVPDEPPANSAFGLRRMLRPWGEGNKNATGANPPGRGLPADPGEATWLCAFAPTNAWSVPGGTAGVDFSSSESSFQSISGIDSYRFESTPELVADLQDWVSHPESNYGWLLLCGDEGTIFTARRFGSREDPNHPPSLEIEYFVPLVPPQIDSIQKIGDQFNLSFVARAGQSYVVEFRDSLTTGTWQPAAQLSPFQQDTRILVVDTTLTAPRRFYRLNTF